MTVPACRVGGVVVQHRPSGVIQRIELVGGEVRLLEKDDVVGVGEREDELKAGLPAVNGVPVRGVGQGRFHVPGDNPEVGEVGFS